ARSADRPSHRRAREEVLLEYGASMWIVSPSATSLTSLLSWSVSCRFATPSYHETDAGVSLNPYTLRRKITLSARFCKLLRLLHQLVQHRLGRTGCELLPDRDAGHRHEQDHRHWRATIYQRRQFRHPGPT